MERRLAAILAADVVGYSKLMGEDQAGTLTALRSLRSELMAPAVETHHGQLVKSMGDGWLLEFPSASDAVICAIEVQEALTEHPSIKLRIGLHVGDVISEDEDLFGDGVNIAARLQNIAAPGGIIISDTVWRSIDGKQSNAFVDLGPQELKNIEKPVTAFAWGFAAGSEESEAKALPLPDKPSIAVLPFANLSSDLEQDYFSDGFTEDVITNVAQSKDLFVIARNSVFTYKGRAVEIRQIAEELGVRYVVEGSVRQMGDKIRITAQLIDAASGAHIWSKRYDEIKSKLFDMQDDLSNEIAGALLAGVNQADLVKIAQKRPKDHSAYDFVLRARALWAKASRETTLQARALAEQAIAIDPSYASAHVVLGDTYIIAYIVQWEGPEALENAYEAAQRAVSLDPRSPEAHALLARTLLRRHQHAEAIVAHENSITLNPSRAESYAFYSDTLMFMGCLDAAIEKIFTAMRLDPFYPALFDLYLGRAYYFAEQYDKAAERLLTCTLRAPNLRAGFMFLAPTYVALGQRKETEQAANALLALAPQFSIQNSVKEHLPFVSSQMDFYIRGLRQAGLPE